MRMQTFIPELCSVILLEKKMYVSDLQFSFVENAWLLRFCGLFLQNSLTLPPYFFLLQNSITFQVFQVAGHPRMGNSGHFQQRNISIAHEFIISIRGSSCSRLNKSNMYTIRYVC